MDKCQTTVWQKMSFWLNILKQRCWLKSDVLTSFWVITLTKLPVDLAHLLPRPPRCHPKQVVCQNSEHVYSVKMLFSQTLRVFALCQNSENVYFVKRFIFQTLRMFIL